MDYMTTSEAARAWNISRRRVGYLLESGRIPGAQKKGKLWLIPKDAGRPADGRRRVEKPSASDLSLELEKIIKENSGPLAPDGICPERDAERAYLQGDFARVLACFRETSGCEAAKLYASLAAVAAAISLGDYLTYREIEDFLKACITGEERSLAWAYAELGLASAAVSVNAPKMVPEWLKAGDFGVLPLEIRPFALYLRTKYLFYAGQAEAALAAGQTGLALCPPGQGAVYYVIYLHISCALACCHLGRIKEAENFLTDAMRLSLPQGFITPFAEVVTHLGGLVESCLKKDFPDSYTPVLAQWERTVKNWISFHNQFTKDNITLLLTLREYYVAAQLARKIP